MADVVLFAYIYQFIGTREPFSRAIMKYFNLISALALSASAFSIAHPYRAIQSVLGSVTDTEKYHIELSPGDTRWVTEEEKWSLKRVWSFKHTGFQFSPSASAWNPRMPTKISWPANAVIERNYLYGYHNYSWPRNIKIVDRNEKSDGDLSQGTDP